MRYDREMGYRRFQRAAGWRPEFAPGFAYDGEFGYAEEFAFSPEFDYDAEMSAAARQYAQDFQDVQARRHGYGMGYDGGALRSRGSYQAGQRRSGLNARDAFEFEWGDGYIGGRGYGGTNYDYQHGYATGASRRAGRGAQARSVEPPQEREESSPATRGGYEWGEERELYETFGPARYGLGPYHDRLQRPRRSDDEIQRDVEDTLFYDTWVDADRIEVAVKEGIVTLRGELPDFQEIRYATDDAWDVEGVRGVRPELRVAGGARGAEERGEARVSERGDDRAVGERAGANAAEERKAAAPALAASAGGSGTKASSKRAGGKKTGGR